MLDAAAVDMVFRLAQDFARGAVGKAVTSWTRDAAIVR